MDAIHWSRGYTLWNVYVVQRCINEAEHKGDHTPVVQMNEIWNGAIYYLK